MDTANDNGMFCVDRSPESDDYCQVSALGLEKLLLNPPQNETGFHNETSTEIAVPAPFNSEDMIDLKLAMDEASSCISEILFPENYIPNILMEANNTELPHITQSEVQQSLATNGNQPQDILLANSQSVTQYMDTNEEFTIPMTQGSSQSTEAPILTQDSINMAVLETNNVKSVLSFSQNYQIIDVSKRQPSIKKPASEAAIMKEIKDIHRNIEKSLSRPDCFINTDLLIQAQEMLSHIREIHMKKCELLKATSHKSRQSKKSKAVLKTKIKKLQGQQQKLLLLFQTHNIISRKVKVKQGLSASQNLKNSERQVVFNSSSETKIGDVVEQLLVTDGNESDGDSIIYTFTDKRQCVRSTSEDPSCPQEANKQGGLVHCGNTDITEQSQLPASTNCNTSKAVQITNDQLSLNREILHSKPVNNFRLIDQTIEDTGVGKDIRVTVPQPKKAVNYSLAPNYLTPQTVAGPPSTVTSSDDFPLTSIPHTLSFKQCPIPSNSKNLYGCQDTAKKSLETDTTVKPRATTNLQSAIDKQILLGSSIRPNKEARKSRQQIVFSNGAALLKPQDQPKQSGNSNKFLPPQAPVKTSTSAEMKKKANPRQSPTTYDNNNNSSISKQGLQNAALTSSKVITKVRDSNFANTSNSVHQMDCSIETDIIKVLLIDDCELVPLADVLPSCEWNSLSSSSLPYFLLKDINKWPSQSK